MPTPERCRELGVKHEGLYLRTQMWLMGVSCGISYVSGETHTELVFPTKNTITFDCLGRWQGNCLEH